MLVNDVFNHNLPFIPSVMVRLHLFDEGVRTSIFSSDLVTPPPDG